MACLDFAAIPAFFSALRSALSECRRREVDSSCTSVDWEGGVAAGYWLAVLCSLGDEEKDARLAASQASPMS